MANFFDLPKPIQTRIFRLHLVRDIPIDLEALEELCDDGDGTPTRDERRMPCLMRVSPKVENATAAMFYAENTFEFKDIGEISQFDFRTWPRHKK